MLCDTCGYQAANARILTAHVCPSKWDTRRLGALCAARANGQRLLERLHVHLKGQPEPKPLTGFTIEGRIAESHTLPDGTVVVDKIADPVIVSP